MSYGGTTGNGMTRYRCSSDVGSARANGRCGAKILRADWIEPAFWEQCRQLILNPGKALDEARRKLRERMTTSTGFETRRRETLAALAEKETERERVLSMYRRGKISDEEADRELDAIAREAGQLREDLESLCAQAALIEAQEAYLSESTALLARLGDELAQIEATNDLERKRDIITRYVRKIAVKTTTLPNGRKEADVRVYLRLKPEPVAVDNATCSPGARPWRQSGSSWRSGGFTGGSG